MSQVSLRDIRSYPRLELALEPGLVLVTGPNGAGKTNLLEAVHVATQGISFRTRQDAQIVRRGAEEGLARVAGRRGDVGVETEVRLSVRDSKRIRLNGATVASAEELRSRAHTLVFTPDRLAVVKGGPAARRAYFDRVLVRALPARADLPTAYGAALGQRNAALRRVAAGLSDVTTVDPWTAQVAALAGQLVDARARVLSLLSPVFEERASELGLEQATLGYDIEPPSREALDERLSRDLERGTTGLGPHLDEIRIAAGDRDLRTFGSQGEQRIAVLALLLAEAELLAGQGGVAPLLLLDDALSELDADRRRLLSARLGLAGQTLVTATGAEALPLAPAQLLAVTPGEVRPA
ncbi:MAG TPA: DNA replication and repair protein RecF [Gaiella sp.]|uniref:DNA replication/repair protein RecF n=1 Tax=Gaiella sp. TaxID=2663207 RepID=UPI002D7F938A|nr:DNA replication and repair protein RecF [Gaiella sp.]HET9286065.1 DNA replication and repair protein RecF [Gaiella sp.]